MRILFFKIVRKCTLIASKIRGFIYFSDFQIYVDRGVQLKFPETIIHTGPFSLKSFCRLESSTTDSIKLGNNVTICSFTTIETAGGNIEIGDNVIVGEYSTIQGQGGVLIEQNVLLASHIHIISNNHSFENVELPISMQANDSAKIHIRENTWIGINVVIQAGVTIGKNSVIGSGSVVRDNIPDYCVAVGIPAKVIKKYDFQLNKWTRVNY